MFNIKLKPRWMTILTGVAICAVACVYFATESQAAMCMVGYNSSKCKSKSTTVPDGNGGGGEGGDEPTVPEQCTTCTCCLERIKNMSSDCERKGYSLRGARPHSDLWPKRALKNGVNDTENWNCTACMCAGVSDCPIEDSKGYKHYNCYQKCKEVTGASVHEGEGHGTYTSDLNSATNSTTWQSSSALNGVSGGGSNSYTGGGSNSYAGSGATAGSNISGTHQETQLADNFATNILGTNHEISDWMTNANSGAGSPITRPSYPNKDQKHIYRDQFVRSQSECTLLFGTQTVDMGNGKTRTTYKKKFEWVTNKVCGKCVANPTCTYGKIANPPRNSYDYCYKPCDSVSTLYDGTQCCNRPWSEFKVTGWMKTAPESRVGCFTYETMETATTGELCYRYHTKVCPDGRNPDSSCNCPLGCPTGYWTSLVDSAEHINDINVTLVNDGAQYCTDAATFDETTGEGSCTKDSCSQSETCEALASRLGQPGSIISDGAGACKCNTAADWFENSTSAPQCYRNSPVASVSGSYRSHAGLSKSISCYKYEEASESCSSNQIKIVNGDGSCSCKTCSEYWGDSDLRSEYEGCSDSSMTWQRDDSRTIYGSNDETLECGRCITRTCQTEGYYETEAEAIANCDEYASISVDGVGTCYHCTCVMTSSDRTCETRINTAGEFWYKGSCTTANPIKVDSCSICSDTYVKCVAKSCPDLYSDSCLSGDAFKSYKEYLGCEPGVGACVRASDGKYCVNKNARTGAYKDCYAPTDSHIIGQYND